MKLQNLALITILSLQITACVKTYEPSPMTEIPPMPAPALPDEPVIVGIYPSCTKELVDTHLALKITLYRGVANANKPTLELAQKRCVWLKAALKSEPCVTEENLEIAFDDYFEHKCKAVETRLSDLAAGFNFPSLKDERKLQGLKDGFKLVVADSELAKTVIRENSEFVFIQGDKLFLKAASVNLAQGYCSVSGSRQQMNLSNGVSFNFEDIEHKSGSFFGFSPMPSFHVSCSNAESDEGPWTVQRFQKTLGNAFEVAPNE